MGEEFIPICGGQYCAQQTGEQRESNAIGN